MKLRPMGDGATLYVSVDAVPEPIALAWMLIGFTASSLVGRSANGALI
jgi:hypothetical protein